MILDFYDSTDFRAITLEHALMFGVCPWMIGVTWIFNSNGDATACSNIDSKVKPFISSTSRLWLEIFLLF